MNKTFSLALLLITFMTAGTLAAAPAEPTSPPPAGQPAPQAPVSISGTVLETMKNGGYSYVYLQQKSGDKVWVAVMEMPIKTGSTMEFKPGMVMNNFESKGLKRTFEAVVFSDGPVSAPDQKVQQGAATGSTTAKDEKISVAKATGPNAITVAEAFTNGKKLDKKKVVVSGKVVKVSNGIMKRNWIHIQDGTGSQKKGTNNLVCTSKETAHTGDVITVSGTLIKDRDFGSGYSYKAIIENATFAK